MLINILILEIVNKIILSKTFYTVVTFYLQRKNLCDMTESSIINLLGKTAFFTALLKAKIIFL